MRSLKFFFVTTFLFFSLSPSLVSFANCPAALDQTGDDAPGTGHLHHQSILSPSKFLVFPHGDSLSHTSRVLELARELRRRGHTVIFASDGKYPPIAEKEGFAVLPHPIIPFAQVDRVDRSGKVDYYTVEQARDHTLADLALIEREKPIAVVADFRPTTFTAAEKAGVPAISIVNAAWTHYYSADVIVPEHFPGGRFASPLSRWLNTTRLRGATQSLLKAATQSVLRGGAKAHNVIRKELGLEPVNDLFELWEGDLTLLADLPTYSPTADLPENFAYVGPLTWTPGNFSLPAWADQIDRTKPVIYVTMGSTGDPKYLHEAVEAFKNSPYQLIISTAGLTEITNPPPNIFVERYIPGDRAMDIADLVICQGGNGTVYQALRAGKPIIGIPAIPDQEIFNMYRVRALGAGITLSDKGYRKGNLEKAIRQVMDDLATYKKNASQMAEEFAALRGAETAADLIEKFLVKGRH